MKIILLGAGSYVFGPSFLAQVFLEHEWRDFELVLVDSDPDAAQRMLGAAIRLSGETGCRVDLRAETSLEAAGGGADYVVCAAAPRVGQAFSDCLEACAQHYPEHRVTEFGGVYGIDSTLRQIRFIRGVAEWMQKKCPAAWLLNVTNPLPRVCLASQLMNICTVGFCSAGLEVYRWIGSHSGRPSPKHPFTPAHEQYQAVAAGLNHFSFLLELADQSNGRDVWPDVRQDWLAGEPSPGWSIAERLGNETGHPACSNDDHTRDFVPLSWDAEPIRETQHGSRSERRTGQERLSRFASDELSWPEAGAPVAWERTADFIDANRFGGTASFHALNLPNDGLWEWADAALFIETPVTIHKHQIIRSVPAIPERLIPILAEIGRFHLGVTRAACEQSWTGLRESMEIDPTIDNTEKAESALKAAMIEHKDLLSPGWF